MQLTQLQRTANQREVGQLSWVELCRYKRAFTEVEKFDRTSTSGCESTQKISHF